MKSGTNGKLLAIDAGWPCTLYEYYRELKTIGYSHDRIAWAVVTHFHMDHAGLVSAFIDEGITCYVFEHQQESIDAMEKIILKNHKEYRTIDKRRLVSVNAEDSKELFASLGIHGTVIATPGHSPDSISFISDEHEVIIGDLAPVNVILPDDVNNLACWELIRSTGGKQIYPSHAEPFVL